jgi:L-lactate dehydrogenase complex protein LldG
VIQQPPLALNSKIRDVPAEWSTFTARAELLGAAVLRATSEDTLARLLMESTEGFVCTRSAANKFPRVADQASAAAQGEVVAAAQFGVEETGSVAIDEPADDRGRCFLAERLWLVVGYDALVPDLDLALQRIGQLIHVGGRHPLLMSGPSRTADIERVLTIGVHGPRALAIVILGDESPA